MYDILASIHMLMGDPVFHVCLGSRIRAPLSETREIYVILYHNGASPLRSQCMKDSRYSMSQYSSCGGSGDAPAVCAPMHAGRGRSMTYLESLVSFQYTKCFNQHILLTYSNLVVRLKVVVGRQR